MRAIPLPASMICLTASGASSGGGATPLPRATAVSTAFEPPDAGFGPCNAKDGAALVGALSVPVSPGSAAVAAADEEASPATGATVFAREDDGSGGRST